MFTIEDAIRILRGYKGEQATQTLLNRYGARCAMGVLGGEELGLVTFPNRYGNDIPNVQIFRGTSALDRDADIIDQRIADCYGITSGEIDMIEGMNDGSEDEDGQLRGGLTFVQIADRLEEYVRDGRNEDSI